MVRWAKGPLEAQFAASPRPPRPSPWNLAQLPEAPHHGPFKCARGRLAPGLPRSLTEQKGEIKKAFQSGRKRLEGGGGAAAAPAEARRPERSARGAGRPERTRRRAPARPPPPARAPAPPAPPPEARAPPGPARRAAASVSAPPPPAPRPRTRSAPRPRPTPEARARRPHCPARRAESGARRGRGRRRGGAGPAGRPWSEAARGLALGRTEAPTGGPGLRALEDEQSR